MAKDKFTPLTDVQPSDDPEDQINLKEQDSQDEPGYLDQADQPEEITEPSPKANKASKNKSLETDEAAYAPPANQESTANYANYEPDTKPKRSFKTPLIIVIVVVVAAGAAYYLLGNKKQASTSTTASSSQSQQNASGSTTTPAASSTKISSTLKGYTSSAMGLAISYPNDWTVVDTAPGVITFTSPSIQLKNASGTNVNGQILMTIRDKSQKLTEFDKGSATATRDSLKIAYTKPTQTQRGSTYVSYLQYATTTISGGLDSLFITGDSGYKKAQNIPAADVTKVDPRVSISFLDANGKALTIADSMMDDTIFSDALIGILKSLSVN